MQPQSKPNYETMNSGNTKALTVAVSLAANPIVEKCLAKMANDVTTQVRDKLIDIIIAVLTRECEDFDGESVRRLIVAELETTPLMFELEKRAASSGKKTKTPKTPKAVEFDAEGNPVKKVRAPPAKEPKAPKVVLTDEDREARDAAKKVEKEAAKEARRVEREAEKETAKLAKEAEKEARRVEKEAEKEAAKLTKVAKPAKEQRIPIPWCGARIPDRCEALRSYHGLLAQCTADSTETSAFCLSCEKTGAVFGTCAMRASSGLFDYTDPKGRKCVKLANVVDKFGVEGGIGAFIAEAAKHGITIPEEHLEKEVKSRGRPKSSSPRAKIATSDTGSGSETETDDEEHQAKKAKQPRKKVTKTASAASDEIAPKKRGRPTKPKEEVLEAKDDLITQLVANAKKSESASATPVATPVATELIEEEVETHTPAAAPVVVTKPAAASKLSAKPKTKVAAPPARKVVTIDGQAYWLEQWNGCEILVNCADLNAFDRTEGEMIGTWDDKTKTLTECEEEEIESENDEE